MNNSGIFDLGSREITAALTDEVLTDGSEGEFIVDLEGMTAVSIQVRLVYGSGGTTVKVDVETSLDQGASWISIARLAFTTASAIKVVNLSGLTPKTTPATPAVLSDDTCLDGILGDRLRAKVTSTGTYGGSTSIAVRAAVR